MGSQYCLVGERADIDVVPCLCFFLPVDLSTRRSSLMVSENSWRSLAGVYRVTQNFDVL